MNTLLHIIQEREEDSCELLEKLREVSVGWLPQNGVKYVKSCCKQILDLFRLHGKERGRVFGGKTGEINQGLGLSQNHGA